VGARGEEGEGKEGVAVVARAGRGVVRACSAKGTGHGACTRQAKVGGGGARAHERGTPGQREGGQKDGKGGKVVERCEGATCERSRRKASRAKKENELVQSSEHSILRQQRHRHHAVMMNTRVCRQKGACCRPQSEPLHLMPLSVRYHHYHHHHTHIDKQASTLPKFGTALHTQQQHLHRWCSSSGAHKRDMHTRIETWERQKSARAPQPSIFVVCLLAWSVYAQHV
jgi:hypothetical protein